MAYVTLVDHYARQIEALTSASSHLHMEAGAVRYDSGLVRSLTGAAGRDADALQDEGELCEQLVGELWDACSTHGLHENDVRTRAWTLALERANLAADIAVTLRARTPSRF